ncbi:hypothetical protein [Rickettsia endosymbiont of Oedothorax gibbosus]|uniref:hypothetical protein n=1 Tax=Rickettsia endosymbiont of Oedothorax gibbosus TaxID=931099 RepID=UPI002024FA5F|nr:hypothetical protein [Rickettsia endosymbiont of Oedothorax gibbosus]
MFKDRCCDSDIFKFPPNFRKKMLKDGKRGYGGAIELGNDFFRRFVVPSKQFIVDFGFSYAINISKISK